MKITVDKREFAKALTRAAAIAAKKSALPLLSCVHLDTGTNAVSVSATDLYIESESLVTAHVVKSGVAAVPAKDLLERVKAMPDGQIELAVIEGRATLSAAGSKRRFVVQAARAEDFPRPSPVGGSGATIECGTLALLLDKTHYAISTDETRAHVNSALLKWSESITIAATDGHRLSVAELPVNGSTKLGEVLVPLRAVSEVRRLLSESPDDAEVNVSRDEQRIRFACSDVSITIKRVDAQFPPYAQVIPKSSKTTVRAPRVALLEALASVATSNASGGVAVSFAGESIHVDAQDGSGEGHDEVSIELVDGKLPKKLSVGFQSKYMRDALSSLKADEVTIRVSGALEPIVIESSEENFVGVVMPMRLGPEQDKSEAEEA